MNIQELITYEVANCKLSFSGWNDWMQERIANYIARKTTRKYKKYCHMLAMRKYYKI